MCGCYDVADFVCFLTFFITALVALLSVQYLVVFLDSFSSNSPENSSYFFKSLYFWLMTLLGCMVFAGIQRRSVALLKWPGRLLVFLLITGLIAVTAYLWIVDQTHQSGVHDLTGKTVRLFVMLCVVVSYFVAIHKLILNIQNVTLRGALSIPTLGDDSDQTAHPTIDDFIAKRQKGRKSNKFIFSQDLSRPINVASDGINYYVVLLESPRKKGDKESRFATIAKSKIDRKGDNHDFEDNGSCSSITEV